MILIVNRKLFLCRPGVSCLTARAGDGQKLAAFDGIEVERGITTTGTPWVEIA